MKKLTFILSITLTLTAFAQVPSYVPTNGLVGWWPFNGNANDESGNGNNGTVNGATLTTDRFGEVGNAYLFDENFITIENLSVQSNWTISGWFEAPISNNFGYQYFFGFGSQSFSAFGIPGFGLTGLNQQTPCFNLQPEALLITDASTECLGVNFLSNYVPNTWYHVVIIGQGSSFSVYIDGELIWNGNLNPINLDELIVGTRLIGYLGFKGKLDDIGIWNRALTPQEVAALYNGCQQTIAVQPQSQTASFNDNVQFTAVSSDPNATYQWQTNLGLGFQNLTDAGQYSGSGTNTLNVSNVTLSNNNQQFRCIIASGSCSDTSDVALLTVNDNLSISENSEQLVNVYPNPAKETITISSDASIIGKDFSITNQLGQVVILGKLVQQEMSIDLSDLTTGVYVIRIDGVENTSFRIVKE
jgi:hypothetical protein